MTAAANLTPSGSLVRRRAGGFTYLGLVILLAVLGLVGAAGLKIDALLRRAQAEQELLEIGAAFSDALQSYAAASPKGTPQQPPSLQELLRDPRFPGIRRHLRKLFVDPVTGKAEWGVSYLGDKSGVIAVYSLSQAKPFKVANFDARFAHFENRQHLSDWKFTMPGQEKPLKSTLPPQQTMALGLPAPGAAEPELVVPQEKAEPEKVEPPPPPPEVPAQDAETAPPEAAEH